MFECKMDGSWKDVAIGGVALLLMVVTVGVVVVGGGVALGAFYAALTRFGMGAEAAEVCTFAATVGACCVVGFLVRDA